jgi:radical SAM protein with 4Fe4S-binding SPASM domain
MADGLRFQRRDTSGFTNLFSLTRDPHQVLFEELGPAYQAYRELWDRTSNFESIPGFPIHLDIELNYSCNFRCPMCPHGMPDAWKPDYNHQWMDFELFARVIDEGVRAGLRSVRLNQLNEPLMRRDLDRFVAYARDAGVIDIHINTNGALLTRERSERLITAGLTQLRVSIDASTPETFNLVRVGGNYETVVRNVREFIAVRQEMGRRLPLLRVSFVRTAENEHEVEAFVEQWSDVADYYAVSDYSNWAPESVTGATHYPSTRLNVVSEFRCPQPWQRATIYANGDVFPCCSETGRRHPVGNVRDQSLAAMWNSPVVQQLRTLHTEGRWRDNPICRSCVESSNVVND